MKRPSRGTTTGSFVRRNRPQWACVFLTALVGCGKPSPGPVVYYLDGAGWYSSASSVKQGLADAGYQGRFEEFSWSAYLGPMHDHLITAKSKSVARYRSTIERLGIRK